MKAKPAEVMIKRTEITIETVSVTRIRRANARVFFRECQNAEPVLELPETTSTEEKFEEKE